MELPQAFCEKMSRLLGGEYQAFLKSYDREAARGLRLNLLKTDRERFEEEQPFPLSKIPWAEEGYYYKEEARPGRHPYHQAGVYYIQEPSAMAVGELLNPRPGELVLDLCAAPGGKTSHIASKLQGEGFLLSNEIHPSRAQILSQNTERMGIGNAVVTSAPPALLAACFPGFFDCIAVDAPCSGEGMFRKDEEAVKEWGRDRVALCAARQQEILEDASRMLKPGGRMVYSTCTFSPEENERTVEAFLNAHPGFSLERGEKPSGLSAGVPEWSSEASEELKKTVRIWPHRTEGEGHFMALLRKAEEEGDRQGEDRKKMARPAYLRDRAVLRLCRDFLEESVRGERKQMLLEREEFVLFGSQLFLLPPQMPEFSKLKVLRPGLHMGMVKKDRFEPSHALALYLREEEGARFCRLAPDSPLLAAYLRGEALSLSEVLQAGGRLENWGKGREKGREKGWTLISAGGYTIGWAKLSNGVLKNHYPKGLRLRY